MPVLYNGLSHRHNTSSFAIIQTILSSATHYYFDHPYEPDPYDRGLYWATRLASSRKVFNFMPDDMYENMGVDGYGHPLDKDHICQTYGCMPLEPDKVDNIIGKDTGYVNGWGDWMLFLSRVGFILPHQ